jgi:putative redox protein
MAERVTFDGSDGRRLVGRLDLPIEKPRAYALFAHCFTCGKDSVAATRIARALTERGIGVLRFDVAGLGESPGDFADTTFSCDVSDLVASATFLRERDQSPALLIGHSLGGAAVLAAAQRIAGVRAVVTIGAPSDPAHVTNLFGDAVATMETEGEADVVLAGRPFRLRRAFLDDIREQPQLERIGRLALPLLVMHSPLDTIVGIDNARIIFDAARHPKSFISLDGADHLLTRPSDARYAADLLAAWASKYIAADEPNREAVETEQGLVTVREAGAGRYRQLVTAGRHT